MIDVRKVLADAEREMERLKEAEVVLKINIVSAVRIIGMVQLSLRHPELQEENKAFGLNFCNNLIDLIERVSPDLAGFCRLGFGAVPEERPSGTAGVSAQSALTVNIYDSVEQAPNYRSGEYKGIQIERANVVRKGTQEGRSTVDLVLQDESGQKYMMMLTGLLIRHLAGIIGEEQ